MPSQLNVGDPGVIVPKPNRQTWAVLNVLLFDSVIVVAQTIDFLSWRYYCENTGNCAWQLDHARYCPQMGRTLRVKRTGRDYSQTVQLRVNQRPTMSSVSPLYLTNTHLSRKYKRVRPRESHDSRLEQTIEFTDNTSSSRRHRIEIVCFCLSVMLLTQ